MNLCKDCEFYHIGDCKHPNNRYTDHVSGELLILNAFQQRTIRYYVRQCGSEGHWFSPKWALPEMLKCPDGHAAYLHMMSEDCFQVQCGHTGCLHGMARKSREEAVKVWNQLVMQYHVEKQKTL